VTGTVTTTNPTLHAVRVGLRRGWTEFLLSLRSPQDQGSYLLVGAGVLLYLWLNRTDQAAGTDLLLPTVALPSIIGGLVAFGIVTGPAGTLAMEREDGTLLRMKAVPRGLVGYVAGQLLYQSLGLLPMLAVILVPGALLFDGVMPSDPVGWLRMVGFLLLGLLATMPIGIVLGSVVPSLQKVNSWGMLPMLALTGISGILVPIDRMWGWLQGVAQVFPMYWLGLGLRSAFLPESAAAFELGGSWRTGTAIVVLVTWAVAGTLLAPAVLRRMARRQSGASVAAARETAAQWVH
jgi:ABC-2 type transport system permease protein